MNDYHFHVNHRYTAKELIERYHYSRAMVPFVVFTGTLHEDGGLFGDLGRCIAAAVFTGTSNPKLKDMPYPKPDV